MTRSDFCGLLVVGSAEFHCMYIAKYDLLYRDNAL